ncbi:MAG: protein kinase [Acidobacteriaceae bacterium]|nr:protein kinase [Acidobacteriaceae bacterium]
MGKQFKKIGKYDSIEPIGRGGAGTLYKAQDPALGRNVIIKVLAPLRDEDPEMLKRFNLEAESLSELRHPNINPVYEWGVEDSRPYLVVEYLDADSLDSLIRARSSMPLDEKLNIILQVCQALDCARQHGVIHRNLKPSNLMVLKDGSVKVVDFEIASLGSESARQSGNESFQYQSPEQLSGAQIDARSDLFSVGVVLFQLLTGKLPWEATEAGELLSKIRNEGPGSLKRIVKNCPPGLDEIVQRALAKAPEQRYQTGEEFGSDLTRILEKWKRERISEYLQSAETAATQRQWARAKDYLLQVLKWDPQNARAKVRLREAQAEFQRQEGSAGAKELLAEAEHALARSDTHEASEYLNQAFKLDPGNTQIVRLREVFGESQKAETKPNEPVRAAVDRNAPLEGARSSVQQAPPAAPPKPQVRELQVPIAQPPVIVPPVINDRQKQVQDLVAEAKKRISQNDLSAALQLLRQAQTLDPSASGIKDLLVVAEARQQEERRRADLKNVTAQVQEAFAKQDYVTAAARIRDGLATFPNDPELLKLKLDIESQQRESEKRRDIEQQLADARKLVESNQLSEALDVLQRALHKYPAETSLERLSATVQQSIEKKRMEDEKSDVIRRARDFIQLRKFSDAILLLETACKETNSGDLDELLQLARSEAGAFAKRQSCEAIANQARQLVAEEKYPEAQDLLESALHDFPDPQLRTMLADIARRMADLKSAVDKALFTAEQLERRGRYAEAIKFLEAQDSQYRNVPGFAEAVHQFRQREQAIQAVVTLKEQVRNALAAEDIGSARALYQNFQIPLGATDSIQTELVLVRLEIEAKQTEVADRKIGVAIRDAQLLSKDNSPDAALKLLNTVAPFLPFGSAALQEQFQGLQAELTESAKPKPAPVTELLSINAIADLIAKSPLTEAKRRQPAGADVPPPVSQKNADHKPQAASSEVMPKGAEKTALPSKPAEPQKTAVKRAEEAAKAANVAKGTLSSTPEAARTSAPTSPSVSSEPQKTAVTVPGEPAKVAAKTVEPSTVSPPPESVNTVLGAPAASSSEPILSLSKSSEIAVQIAEFEGVRSRHEYIEPEHFLLGILSLEKVFEADVQREFRLTPEAVESVRSEFEPLQSLLVAKGVNSRMTRRILRELLQKRFVSRSNQTVLAARPSPRIQGLCVRAVNVARSMYSAQIRIEHFLLALIEEGQSLLPEFLQQVHLSSDDFAKELKAFRQSPKRTPVRVLNATSTAIPLTEVREVSFAKTQILEAVNTETTPPPADAKETEEKSAGAAVADSPNRSAARFKLLCELSSEIERETRVEPILHRFLTGLLAAIPGADRGAVLIKGNNAEELLLKAYVPQSEPVINLEAACRAMETKQAFISKQEMDSDTPNPSFGMYAPLVWKGQILGVICLDGANADQAFESDDLKTLVAVAQQTCMLLNDMQLQEDLKRNVGLLDRLLTNFSPKVRSRLLDRVRRGRLQLGGERSEVTILFSDIRGFTNLSAGMDTEDILELLNQCFSLAADSIFKFDGTIDKFIGDAVLAVFGSPDPDPQHHANALRAAANMQQAMVELNQQRAARGQKVFEIGIGLHCGEVLHGFVGASERMEFTVIGDAVNLASRFCSAAKAGEILISPELYQRVWQRVEASQLTIPTKHEGPLLAYKVRSLKPQAQKKYA